MDAWIDNIRKKKYHCKYQFRNSIASKKKKKKKNKTKQNKTKKQTNKQKLKESTKSQTFDGVDPQRIIHNLINPKFQQFPRNQNPFTRSKTFITSILILNFLEA